MQKIVGPIVETGRLLVVAVVALVAAGGGGEPRTQGQPRSSPVVQVPQAPLNPAGAWLFPLQSGAEQSWSLQEPCPGSSIHGQPWAWF